MKRQRMKKRYISLLLILALSVSMLLTACQNSDAANLQTEDTQNVSMQKGRYAEEEVVFPKKLKNLFDLEKKENGLIQILFESEPGSLYLYESSDQAKTWQSRLEIEAGKLPQGYRAADACVKDDGTIIVSVGEMSSEAVEQKQPIGKYEYYTLQAEDGYAQALLLDMPEASEAALDKGFGLINLEVSEDNFLYGVLETREGETSQYSTYCFDLGDGKQKWSKKTSQGEFALYGNRVYLNEGGMDKNDTGKLIKTLDAKTGEETGSVTIPSEIFSIGNVDLDQENQRLFFSTKEGIFSTDYEMTLQEKLVDGKAGSLSKPGYHINAFYMLSESVLLLFMQDDYGEEIQALRYEYNAELSMQPDNQLTVYSLKENSVMDKMIFDFQKQNPDIVVNYEIGMQGQNVTSVSEAVNILNTEIMAGDGPDIIILNGLPWQSYSEKGILADISEEIALITEKEEFFENLFSAYQENNTQYAVPVSFKIPVVLGSKQTVQEINSLDGLVKAAEQSGDIPPFYRRDKNLLRYIVSVCWNSVQQEEHISKTELKALLEQTKKMNDSLEKYEVFQNMFTSDMGEDIMTDAFEVDTAMSMFDINDKLTAMELGYLSWVNSWVDIYNHDLAIGHVSEQVFSPLLVGINEKTTAQDSAKQFLHFILSEEEQKIFSGNSYPVMMNFPVNKDAFRNMIQRPSEEELEEQGEIYKALGKEYIWPDETYFKQLESVITELSIPAMEDTVVMDTVIESAWPYLNGEKDIDTTVNEISQKLELYFAE